MLTKCDGPDCPHCGCRQTKVITPAKEGSWFTSGKAQCQFCGAMFGFTVSQSVAPTVEHQTPVVEHAPVKVEPQTPSIQCTCGELMKVASTRKAIRYYKCERCGKTHKTAR